MKEYVEADYRDGLYKKSLEGHDFKLHTFERRIKLLKKYIPTGKLMDLGCSSGFMVEVALKAGYDAWGIEIAEWAVKAAAPEIKDRIQQGDINLLSSGSYDILTAFDILEHTRQPLEVLKQWAGLIRPGGFLMIATPDTNSILRLLMGSRWPMLQPFQHTFLFSRSHFGDLLCKAGLKTREITTATKVMTPEYLMVQLQRYFPRTMRTGLAVGKALPFLFKRPITFRIGEFLAVAQK